MLLKIPGSGDEPIPLVHTQDTGNFVDALLNLPVGTNMLAFGDRLAWPDYVELWSSITGFPATFEKTTVEEHSKLGPADHSAEMAEMYGYMQDFGFDGGDSSVVYSRDVRIFRLDTKAKSLNPSLILMISGQARNPMHTRCRLHQIRRLVTSRGS